MEIERLKPRGDAVNFTYDGPLPRLDLLDYRYMDIEMHRSAETGNTWMSVLALFLVTFACVGMIFLFRIFSALASG